MKIWSKINHFTLKIWVKYRLALMSALTLAAVPVAANAAAISTVSNLVSNIDGIADDISNGADVIASAAGVVFIILGILSLKNHAYDAQMQGGHLKKAAIYFIVGVGCFSARLVLSAFSQSITGS